MLADSTLADPEPRGYAQEDRVGYSNRFSNSMVDTRSNY